MHASAGRAKRNNSLVLVPRTTLAAHGTNWLRSMELTTTKSTPTASILLLEKPDKASASGMIVAHQRVTRAMKATVGVVRNCKIPN
jgi:hypothetical protein